MRVVLADVEEQALAQAEQALKASGAAVLAVRTDVSRPEEVDRLAAAAMDAFGAVHLVCNNAGVSSASGEPLWRERLATWEWVMGVNLWGVINGVRSFVPLLLEQDEAHVVNTASIAGLIPGVLGIYSVTKHAVVALSEALHLQLAAGGARVGVSVLCPGWVRTNITTSERNRPDPSPPTSDPVAQQTRALFNRLLETGAAPAEVAAAVVEAIRERRFYVLPQPGWLPAIEQRVEDIEQGRAPSPPNLLGSGATLRS
jgi:NAD(P)-dependent dehydrogenase (short-subunit alcohol dehydrogenase family)